MTRSFKLPDLGEGIHEGEVLAVLVTIGQEVNEGDIILEVETDKAAVEVPSPIAGIAKTIHVKEGQTVSVGDVLVTFEDMEAGASAETKLVKNAKWLARKWEITDIVLHSFTHLGEEKADPDQAKDLLDRAQERLEKAGYSTVQTPYGYFLNLLIQAPGHPLARVYKEF